MKFNVRSDTDLGRIRAKLTGAAGDRSGRIARQVYAGVVKRTPVLKGNLRASWNVSLNAPDYTITTGGSPTNPLPPKPFPNLRITQLGVVYISNGQPYARKIEYGGSSKQPQGMLRVTIASIRK